VHQFDLRKLQVETKSVAKMSVLLLTLITSQVGNWLPNFNRRSTGFRLLGEMNQHRADVPTSFA
jgi:hypothetical protein